MLSLAKTQKHLLFFAISISTLWFKGIWKVRRWLVEEMMTYPIPVSAKAPTTAIIMVSTNFHPLSKMPS